MILKGFFTTIISVFFPSYCIQCKVPTDFTQNLLCSTCLRTLRPLTNKCEICSGSINDDQCTVCSNRHIYFKHNETFFEYSGVIKKIFHEIKFNSNKKLIKVLVDKITERLPEYINLIDVITWVPMNKTKKKRRGFNQSYLLACELGQRLKKPVKALLLETKRTETQRTLDFNSRFVNVINRYELRRNVALKQINVLLVDDIFTTGATINECSRLLSNENDVTVYALTFARANISEI